MMLILAQVILTVGTQLRRFWYTDIHVRSSRNTQKPTGASKGNFFFILNGDTTVLSEKLVVN
jgi:hypothetical protein